jgi:hypothetical protein
VQECSRGLEWANIGIISLSNNKGCYFSSQLILLNNKVSKAMSRPTVF